MADEVEAQLASITGDLLEDNEAEKNSTENVDSVPSGEKDSAESKSNEPVQDEVEQTIEEMLTEGLVDEKKDEKPEKEECVVEEKMDEDKPEAAVEAEGEAEKVVEESEEKLKEEKVEEESVVQKEVVEVEKEKSEDVKVEEMVVIEEKKPEEEVKEVPKPEITADAINVSIKEIVTQDVLVCGKCHQVYHFVEAFQDHKANANCKENGELKETLTEDKKPQIWAFTLWKNTKFKDNKEETDKPPTSSIYQTWSDLDEKEKDVWTKAGESIQSLCEIVHQFETIKLAKNKERKQRANEKDAECGNVGKASKEKDPLGMDGETGTDSSEVGTKKTILKPVQLNNKVTIISRKQKNTRKAVRTGSDPKVEHLVEKIVSKRYNPRKKTFEYLIKWENFDSEKNTWEPLASLYNCKTMMEEFEKNLQIQKEQQRIEKMIAKKQQKKQELLRLQAQGRPQRTSKQKALNQVKQWCGNMEADENSGKRYFSDDSDEDETFEKRMKYEDYSSDSEAETPVLPLKRVTKSQNGIEKKPKVESITLPENILIPDAKGIVRINQKQIPSLSSGVYVMSKTAGIIKLDTKASKMATSGGQTVLRVAPKIGQTSIKIIKKDISNGSTPTTTTSTAAKNSNILRAKPPLQKYSSRIYVQKRTNAQNAKKVEPPPPPKIEPEKDDEESDGIEELEFPTDIPIPAPDSPPPEFTLCPLTGKVLGKDGKAIEEPEPEKSDELPSTSESGTAVLDNLVNLAAADILDDLQPKPTIRVKKESDEAVTPMETDCLTMKKEEIEEPSSTIDLATTISHTQPKQTDSILSTALTNANIGVRRPMTVVHRPQQKTVINRTIGVNRSAPQAIITRITPGTSPIQRSRVMAPKPKEATIIRKRTLISSPGGASVGGVNRSIVRRVVEKVYTPASSGGSVNTTVQSTSQSVNSYVATPTSANIVINMPSLIDADTPTTVTTPIKTDKTNASIEAKPEVTTTPAKMEVQEEPQAVPTTSNQNSNSLSIPESETPLLITGEDGTIYQVAGQNEEGQTILITQGEDGEQHCLFVAPENAGLFSQALMKPAEAAPEPEPEPEPVQEVQAPAAVTEPITVNTETEEAADDSQVVAQIVSANPPSPGGTRKVVLMLPDGNFMMTEVTAEQYQALELDK